MSKNKRHPRWKKETNGNYITVTFHYPPWRHTEYQRWQTKVSSDVCEVLLHVCRNDAWSFMNERHSVFIQQDSFFQTLRAQKAAFQERLLLVCSQERKVIVQRLQWSYSTKAGLWKKQHTHSTVMLQNTVLKESQYWLTGAAGQGKRSTRVNQLQSASDEVGGEGGVGTSFCVCQGTNQTELNLLHTQTVLMAKA